MNDLEFYAWGWIEDAFWHFCQAVDYVVLGLRCLWWAVASFAEWAWYSVIGEA